MFTAAFNISFKITELLLCGAHLSETVPKVDSLEQSKNYKRERGMELIASVPICKEKLFTSSVS